LDPRGRGRAHKHKGSLKPTRFPNCRLATCCAPLSPPERRSGLKAKAVMDAGELVSDAIVNAIVAERIDQKDCKKGFILDGYPRTLAQADAVGKMLSKRKLKLDAVIELIVDDKALVGRIVKRAEDAKAAGQPVRKDDNPQVFDERLREYYKKTAPLTGYYYAKKQLA
jgi:adenylate kinase